MKKFIWSSLAAIALVTATFTSVQAADNPPVMDEKHQSVTGTITEINMDAKTITVKGALLSKTFRIGGDAAIESAAHATLKLDGLKVGDEVTVIYHEQGDMLWAHKIM